MGKGRDRERDRGLDNPFEPGPGTIPPHRAGHEAAARALHRCLERVGDGNPGDVFALHGPRGNGKTVLMAEIERRAPALGVTTAWVVPGGLGRQSAEGFAQVVADAIAPFREADSGGASPLAEGVLREASSSRPLVLFVDEAYNLSPAAGECVVHAARRCIADGLPLMVALAGTPGMRPILERGGVWERMRRFRIGRLESPDAARDALAIPGVESGLPFDEDALDHLVAESQRYPFFVQVVGEQSWDAAISRDPDADRITLEDARTGVRTGADRRQAIYSNRRHEAGDKRIRPEILAVSRKFVSLGGDATVSREELGRAVRPGLSQGRSVDAAIRELLTVGLVWENKDLEWEPGIPSLCAHFAKHEAAY